MEARQTFLLSRNADFLFFSGFSDSMDISLTYTVTFLVALCLSISSCHLLVHQTMTGSSHHVDLHRGEKVATVISASFVISAVTAFAELHELVLPDFLAQAGHYQFLTNIALCLSTLYFAVNFLYHYTTWPVIGRVKVYLSAVCLPLNFVVSIVYWGLRLLVPALIMTEKETIPLLLDIKIHVLPLLATATDYFAYMDRWDLSYATGYLFVSIFSGLYWFWLEYLIQDGASYPYPFLNVERNLRILIFMVVSFIAFGAFCLGKLLHPQFIPELEKAEEDFKKDN